MLGISHHNPMVISVYLDRLRLKDLFVSIADVRSGAWRNRLRQFLDLPSDGRERVVFVEAFASLQTIVRDGADLQFVHVVVYDDCEALASVPDITIVDAVYNNGWQPHPLMIEQLNDAIVAVPVGLPVSIRTHRPEPEATAPKQRVASAIESEENEPDEKDDELVDDEGEGETESTLLMERMLDDIEAVSIEDEEDEEEEEDEDEDDKPEAKPAMPVAVKAPKQPARTAAKQKSVAVESQELDEPAAPEIRVVKKTEAGKRKKVKLVSYQLF